MLVVLWDLLQSAMGVLVVLLYLPQSVMGVLVLLWDLPQSVMGVLVVLRDLPHTNLVIIVHRRLLRFPGCVFFLLCKVYVLLFSFSLFFFFFFWLCFLESQGVFFFQPVSLGVHNLLLQRPPFFTGLQYVCCCPFLSFPWLAFFADFSCF